MGPLKDATHGKPILESVGLREKSFSLLALQDDGDKKVNRVAKGYREWLYKTV